MNTPYALGCEPSPPDDRDHTLAMHATVTTIPSAFRSPILPGVLDQKATPECVAFSGTSIATVQEIRDAGRTPRFDQGDFFTRMGGGPNGANIRNAANVWVKTGILLTSGRIVSGERLKAGAYSRLNGLAEMKSAVLAQYAVWLAVTWLNPWFKPLPDGTLPVANPKDIAGGHALAIIGYDDSHRNPDGTLGAFLIQNSWGVNFGLNGRFWMPYSYLGTSPEAWAVFDAADCAITVTPFTPARKWLVAAGHTVNGWSLKTPTAPVNSQRWARASSATCDAQITVTWPGLTPTPALHGTFYRTATGAYAGLWVDASQVALK